MLKHEVLYINGSLSYYQNGKRHRIDHPALLWHNGEIGWYQYGYRHRKNGPAISSLNGYKQYWLRGKKQC